MSISFMSLSELSAQLASRQLSSVDVVTALLEHIRRFDPQVRAFITVLEREALDEARRADEAAERGERVGPLHGVPVALKDNVDVRGVRTTAHSQVTRDCGVAERDAEVTQRLRQAGAVIIGKTALWEFAYGVPGRDDAVPPARNPWSLSHSPGGSSSGSGAAVAAGFAFAAIGTDTGGSIRHPCSVCGLVGMKPTFGLVSQRGVVPVSLSLDHIGPMTRTVRDNALVLQAISGLDAQDPNSVAPPPGLDFTARIGRPLGGLRAAVPVNLIDPAVHDPVVLEAFERALDRLRGMGLEVMPFHMDGFDQVHADSTVILEYEAYREHRERLVSHGPFYGAGLRKRLESGIRRSDGDYALARGKAAELAQRLDRLFAEQFDLLLLPGREKPAMTMEELLAEAPSARGKMTRLGNFTGVPALVMPMGFSSQGLPLALQIVSRRFAEPLIYQVAAAYEADQPWSSRHPDWLCAAPSAAGTERPGA